MVLVEAPSYSERGGKRNQNLAQSENFDLLRRYSLHEANCYTNSRCGSKPKHNGLSIWGVVPLLISE
jgi:hypothetical protein